MTAQTSIPTTQETVPMHARKPVICSALWVAALANALIPIVFFSNTHLFGHPEPGYRAMVALVVLIEYAIPFVLLLLHANVGFSSGYTAATAAIVTLGSCALTYITLAPAGWGWSAFYAEILVLAGFAFAVISNVVFLLASIRYGRTIHPRLHLGGFFLGIGASVALLLIYVRILS